MKNCKISLHPEKTKTPPEGAGFKVASALLGLWAGFAWAILVAIFARALYKTAGPGLSSKNSKRAS